MNRWVEETKKGTGTGYHAVMLLVALAAYGLAGRAVELYAGPREAFKYKLREICLILLLNSAVAALLAIGALFETGRLAALAARARERVLPSLPRFLLAWSAMGVFLLAHWLTRPEVFALLKKLASGAAVPPGH